MDLCAIVQETIEKPFTVAINAPLSDGIYPLSSVFILLYVLTDFSIGDMQLTFSAAIGPQTVCTEVSVASNDGLEDVEMFSVSLTSADPDVTTGPPTQLIISNFDGL